MALHGVGHLELKKMHKGDFWGLFGIRLGRCPCINPEKISFLQFYSRFNPNALALSPLLHDGQLHSDSRHKAEILNQQFCSVFTDEDTTNMPK